MVILFHALLQGYAVPAEPSASMEQTPALAPTEVLTITILPTNDTHGNWAGGAYRGAPNGFAYLATHIAAERAKNPNLLLLDAGGTFQGNACAQYFRNATPNPVAGGLNLLDYDALFLGNHEFNILGTANLDDDVSYGFINDNVKDYITMTSPPVQSEQHRISWEFYGCL
jgi:2',3'-cyclic-nucleotide 2'-phosphodiesterase (5'-nucleotidase family)